MDFKKLSKTIKEKRSKSQSPKEEMKQLQEHINKKNNEIYEKYNTKKDREK